MARLSRASRPSLVSISFLTYASCVSERLLVAIRHRAKFTPRLPRRLEAAENRHPLGRDNIPNVAEPDENDR